MKSNVDVAVVHVVGMGLAGLDSLSVSARQLVDRATLLVGAQRHLDALQVDVLRAASVRESGASGEDVDEDQYVAAPEMWPLGNFSEVFAKLRSHLDTYPQCRPVILATGDPLFFGLGRLLLRAFPPERLVFHPQVSAMQLAFSRLKVSWQDATLLSVHGRDETLLLEALKRGDEKIALLTDGVMTPGAIAALIRASDLPVSYQLWVCENLGGEQEKISLHTADIRTADISSVQSYAALNVVVLLRVAHEPKLDTLPLIGLPDAAFNTYPDRPALMTKREIRLLVLGAIAPLPGQVIWDIGAGTGSVSVELSRLCPSAQIYAIEKTAMGTELVRRNAERLAIAPV
ncbi:MAG: precorrin-6y C5,15-methyltransferase (decarboxylating) subunit CbiE, partial [Cyanobacteria bacterium J06649_4]